jgi:thioredoxin 1
MMTPAIEELAAQYAGKATIAKVNVDNENDLAAKFNVSSIPTLLVFKDGKVAHQFVGVTPKAELAKAIDGALG